MPWRRPGTTAWGVLVSEVMSQQTPVSRVAPQWVEWMNRWPRPSDLAAAQRADVIRAWGKLGYPRRAQRLHTAAEAIATQHGDIVPHKVEDLLALPGIGDYTARAVAAFAYHADVPVVDINVRRVLRRHEQGVFLPGAHRPADLKLVAQLLPDGDAATFSAGLMELGALVCVARTPKCGQCPLRATCAWRAAGCPQPSAEELSKKRVQKFTGTDRQVRGLLMDVLRGAESPVERKMLDAVWDDAEQRDRALESLLADGLAQRDESGRYRL
nr:A/G-specific adenine glycosylase [Corynebacterium sp. TAE3-ERU12]